MVGTHEGKLHSSPLKNRTIHNALDIGTGTGIWAIDFADVHPETQVLGIDLSPIQPNLRPTKSQVRGRRHRKALDF
jgi:ubiquinone/menaquinone biosynthesis C-methylase UbiE